MDWFINRCRGQSIWIDISVVRFLPLSFYAKKKVAERKARIRGIAPRYATLLFGAVSPLYIPLMTAQPIAKVFVYTRNGRLVQRLPFLKEKYHAYHLSLSESKNSYTRIYSTIIQLIFSKGCVPHNGKPNFRPAIISVTLPEKDSLLSKFSPGLFQRAVYLTMASHTFGQLLSRSLCPRKTPSYQSFRQIFFKGLCTSQWQAKLSVSNCLGHSARERLPLIKVFARPFSKGRVPPRTLA